MVFSNNMPTKLEFRVAVEDRFAQKSIDMYRGFVQLFTSASQVCQLPSQSDDGRRRPTANATKVRLGLTAGRVSDVSEPITWVHYQMVRGNLATIRFRYNLV